MASIKTRRTDTGERRYDVRYRLADGKVRNKTFKRLEDARSHARKVERDLLDGTFIDPKASRMTFGDWWAEWWPTTVNLRPSSHARDESYYRNHVGPAFDASPLAAIDHQAIAAFVSEMSGKGKAPATVQKAHQVLSKALRAAVRAGKLRVNPAEHVQLPRVERDEMRFLTPSEAVTLAETIDERYRAFVVVGAYAGLRFGELAALRWSRVDLMHRNLQVAETVVEVRGKHHYGPPKTRAGRRRVPLPRVAVDALTTHQAEHGYDADALVFPAPNGGTIRASLWRRRIWQPATVAAGLGTLKKVGKSEHYEGLRVHDLRHTAVALWIAAGASPVEVAGRAGHTSVSVVLDRYGHLLPGRPDEVNDALDALADAAATDATVRKLRPA